MYKLSEERPVPNIRIYEEARALIEEAKPWTERGMRKQQKLLSRGMKAADDLLFLHQYTASSEQVLHESLSILRSISRKMRKLMTLSGAPNPPPRNAQFSFDEAA